MTYPEAIQYLESFINYEKIPFYPYKQSLKLERVRDFLSSLGNPQDYPKSIHVAGSKGKGSTCAFSAYILRESGYRVGLYTSPHLTDFRERIRILDVTGHRSQVTGQEFEGMISQMELVDLVERLKPAIEEYNSNSEYGDLSFFEVYTSIAFLYFKEKNVDFAVLETGLGGRLDATNCVEPLVCAITPISYEHMQKLGNTLTEIATEKAGIIKSHKLIVISAPQEKEAMQVIRDKCTQVNAALYEVNKDITYERKGESFDLKVIDREYGGLKTNMPGEHQLINAAVSVGIIEGLNLLGFGISEESVKKGLINTVWPGRCELVSKDPLVILDGAQNLASAAALKNTIEKEYSYEKIIMIMGVSMDKDIEGVCREFYNFADKFILTQADNPRAASADLLAGYFQGKEVYLTKNTKEALRLAREKAHPCDLVVISGSLFVVGEIRKLILENN